MVKKRLILILILFFALFLLTTALMFLRKDIYFWELRTRNNTVYMLGTIHVFKPELFDRIDKRVFDAFYSCELILNEKKPALTMGRTYYEAALYPHGDYLNHHIPENYYIELKKILEENNLDIENYKQYRPFYFLDEMLKISQIRYGFDELINSGIDWYLLDKCMDRGIPWDGLEYFDSVYELMEQEMPEAETGYYLVGSVRSYFAEDSDCMTAVEEIIEGWMNGTIDSYKKNSKIIYVSYIGESNDAITVEINRYLNNVHTKRNLNMADTIEEYINSNEYNRIFVMAGVLHFLGEDSIIEALKERGYKVKRIKKSFSWPFGL